MAAAESLDLEVERVGRIACHKCGYNIDVTGDEPLSIVRCRACRTLLRVPAKLGEYLLTQRLGQGASGTTFIARDLKLQRDVAIKVIKQTMGPEGSLAAGVMREARALAALNHRNIVEIYTVEQYQNQPFLVMEMIDGPNLQDYVTEHGVLEETRAINMAIDIAEALKTVHDIGMVHGDVKPGNILLAPGHRTKIVDFGLVRNVEGEDDRKIRGTPYYLAPEQCAGRPADHRADIFSLGATLFFALTGKRPAEGRSVKEVIEAKISRPAPRINTLRPDVCSATETVVRRMLRRKPEDRYATYDDVLADLRKAAEQLATSPEAVQQQVYEAAAANTQQAAPPAPAPNVHFDHGAESHATHDGGTHPVESNPWGGSPVPSTPRPRRRSSRQQRDSAIVAVMIVIGILIIGAVLFFMGLSQAGILG